MSAYDYWKLDNGINEADEARQEAIDERAGNLLTKYAADDAKVLEAVECMNDGHGNLDQSLATFLHGWHGAPDQAAPLLELARNLYAKLWPHVESQLRGDAELEAERERSQWEREQAEMRGGRRDAA